MHKLVHQLPLMAHNGPSKGGLCGWIVIETFFSILIQIYQAVLRVQEKNWPSTFGRGK
jgi:hypothetical protein